MAPAILSHLEDGTGVKRWLIILLASLSAFLSPGSAAEGDGARAKARAEYRAIEDLYYSWDRGWFGSRHYYERKLRAALLERLGARIETDANYLLIFPETLADTRFTCRLQAGGWCVVMGEVSAEALKSVGADSPAALGSWWRSGRLCSVSGTLARYALEQGGPRRIRLYMTGIELHEDRPGK